MADWKFITENTRGVDTVLSSRSYDSRSFSVWINDLLASKSLPKNEIVKASRLNQTFAYQILAGTRHASRDKLIQLAFGMNLNIDEACELLEHGGVNRLSPTNERDVIIGFCLDRGLSLSKCDDLLWSHGLPTIYPSQANS